MKKFEFLEHTADVKIRVFGDSLEDLFKNALLGMTEIQSQISNLRTQNYNSKLKTKRKIKIESADRESLLVDFLSEVLTLSDTNQEVYPEISNIKIENNKLEAEILGYKVDRFDEDIKAVTYHGVRVVEKEGKWEAEIVFDI